MKIKINETQLADLNHHFDWCIEQLDDEDKIIGLGGFWKFKGVNNRIEELNKLIKLENKSILELGCLDGSTTVSLCELKANVTSIDIRPLNLVRTFARCLAFGFNPKLYLKDIRNIESLGKFDILCHFGCFYHLNNPIEHFRNLYKISNVIALETHTDKPNEKNNIIEENNINGYKGRYVKEFGWKDQLSGVDASSFWLDKIELFRLFSDCGWNYTTIWDIENSINGPRSYYLLTK